MGHNRDLNPAQLVDVEDSWPTTSQSPGSIFSSQNVLLKKIFFKTSSNQIFFSFDRNEEKKKKA